MAEKLSRRLELGAKPCERDERQRTKARRIAYSGITNKIQVFPRHRYICFSLFFLQASLRAVPQLKLLCKSRLAFLPCAGKRFRSATLSQQNLMRAPLFNPNYCRWRREENKGNRRILFRDKGNAYRGNMPWKLQRQLRRRTACKDLVHSRKYTECSVSLWTGRYIKLKAALSQARFNFATRLRT